MTRDGPLAFVAAAGLALAVALLYRPCLGYEFLLFDDPVYVTENPHVRAGLSWNGVRWAIQAVGAAGNWHPLTWLSHMLDVTMFGLDPRGHHAVSVGLHVGSALLAFLVLRAVLRLDLPAAGGTAATLAATVGASVFSLHPQRIESVVWIAERKDVLSVLCGLSAVLAHLRFGRTGSRGWRWVTFALLALGLLAKPMLITLPLLLLLLDVWPLRRIDLKASWDEIVRATSRLTAEKIPLLALSVLSAGATFYAQARGGAVSSLAAVTPWARLSNAVASYAIYLGQWVWPKDLSAFYPLPQSQPVWSASAGVVLLATLTAVSIFVARRHPWIGVGWAWFVVTLVPVIGLVHVGLQAHADRYTYLPHVGLSLLVARAIAPPLQAGPRTRVALLATAVAVAAALYGATRSEMRYWADTTTLFRRAAEVARGNFVAYQVLGVAAEVRGDPVAAIEAYRLAIGASPSYSTAHARLARLLAGQGRLAEAMEHARLAVRLEPGDALALASLGAVRLAAGDHRRAADAFTAAVRNDAALAEAWSDLGICLERLGRPAEAVEAYRRAVALRPDLFEAHLNLGGALGRLGRYREAAAALRRAVVLRPDRSDARYGLGVASALAGDPAAAREQLEALEDLDADQALRLSSLLRGTPTAR